MNCFKFIKAIVNNYYQIKNKIVYLEKNISFKGGLYV